MKRTQIKRRPLADSVLKTLEPEDKEYREKDSLGLYFTVKPNGSKSWVLRYKRPDGKWAWKGLGGFPSVSGKLARERSRLLLEIAADGKDLRLYNVKGEVVQTDEPVSKEMLFRGAAEDWYDHRVRSGRSPKTLHQYRTYLDKELNPAIGDKPLSTITRTECAKIQSDIEARGSKEIAKKVRGWLNQIFSRAIAQGQTENNPASELRSVAEERNDRGHYPHLQENELPDFLKALRASNSRRMVQLMIWLVVRTACRPGMARFAEWSEFDLEEGLWTTPAEKMKTRREHIIPLSPQTLADLHELYEMTGQERYLFPGQGSVNPVVSENTINKALRALGYKDRLVGHGARHTASTLLNDHNWDYRLVDSQLAHKIQGVEGVYNKAKYLGQRRVMMNWYSNYLDWLETGSGKKPKDPIMQVPQ